jgi:hypothetical protein
MMALFAAVTQPRSAMPLHPEAVSEFRFIQPCSPAPAKSVPYRLQVAKHGRVMRLYSRRGRDWGNGPRGGSTGHPCLFRSC